MIPDITFKGKIASLILPAIVILVGLASFGLGRLSVLKEEKGTLVIHSAGETPAQTDGNNDQKH